MGSGQRQFEQMVRAFSADLYRYAIRLCRDRFDAEDLLQEAFARAWKAWPELRDLAAAKAWIFAILRNEHARRFAKKRISVVDDEFDESEFPSAPSSVAGLEIEQLFGMLPLTYREPLLLQVLGGFSCSEIASMLGTTEGAVMTRLTRARQALRSELRCAEPRKSAR
ncbi:MAG: RNA polymerase subunit sigma [Betaproteobacteria bacterium RIFCSPLOWO2_12_FULL_65_14]|nr:MAG: RNA polymerase subunit sigma [Betaproteobacteria bacterium RIFCSPLOWO2_12_FULL_65_14]